MATTSSAYTTRNLSRVTVALTAIGLLSFCACRRHPSMPPARLSTSAADAPLASGQDARLAEARRALSGRDYPAALRLAAEAGKHGAPKAEVLEVQAEVYAGTNYIDREIETLRRWTRAAPGDDRPWVKLFYVYQDLGWYVEAGQAATRALKLSPNDPRVHVAGAIFYYRSSEPLRGLPEVERAEHLDPSRPALSNLRGTILMKAMKYQEAEASFRRELTRNPSDLASQIGLAQSLLKQGKTPEAEGIFRAIQRRDPENVEAAFELGAIAEKKPDDAEALRQFETAYRLDRTYGNTAFRLGSILIRRGRADEGASMLRSFHTMEANADAYGTELVRLQKRPNDPGEHYRLARFHVDAGELPQAIAELRRVLADRPGDAAARRDLISSLAANGRRTEARELIATTGEGGSRVSANVP